MTRSFLALFLLVGVLGWFRAPSGGPERRLLALTAAAMAFRLLSFPQLEDRFFAFAYVLWAILTVKVWLAENAHAYPESPAERQIPLG